MSYVLANHLSNNGFNVVFISYRPYFEQRKQITNTLTIVSWKSKNRPKTLTDFIFALTLVWEFKPAITIGHFVGAKFLNIASKIISLGKTKTYDHYHTLSEQILTDHGIKKSNILRARLYYYYFVDFVLPNSQKALNDFQKIYKLNNALNYLTPLPDRLDSKQHNSLPNYTNPNFGFLGRLNISKGLDILIETFASNEHLKLEIAGTGEGYKSIKSNINFIGPLQYEKVDEFISSKTIIIIPSLIDNLVTVGIETLMLQRVLMISSNTGLTDYLTHGFDAIIFDPNSITLSQEIDKILAGTYDLQSIANNGRETYLNKFHPDIYNKWWANEIKRVLPS
jgi:glycosyltransferase involved in cell wall biosynthesis